MTLLKKAFIWLAIVAVMLSSSLAGANMNYCYYRNTRECDPCGSEEAYGEDCSSDDPFLGAFTTQADQMQYSSARLGADRPWFSPSDISLTRQGDKYIMRHNAHSDLVFGESGDEWDVFDCKEKSARPWELIEDTNNNTVTIRNMNNSRGTRGLTYVFDQPLPDSTVRPTSIMDSNENVIAEYDPVYQNGKLTSLTISDQFERETIYQYNDKGQLTKIIYPSPDPSWDHGKVVWYEYVDSPWINDLLEMHIGMPISENADPGLTADDRPEDEDYVWRRTAYVYAWVSAERKITHIIEPEMYDAYKAWIDGGSQNGTIEDFASHSFTYIGSGAFFDRLQSKASCSPCGSSSTFTYDYKQADIQGHTLHTFLLDPVNYQNTPWRQVETRRTEPVQGNPESVLISIQQFNNNGRTLALLTRTGSNRGLLREQSFCSENRLDYVFEFEVNFNWTAAETGQAQTATLESRLSAKKYAYSGNRIILESAGEYDATEAEYDFTAVLEREYDGDSWIITRESQDPDGLALTTCYEFHEEEEFGKFYTMHLTLYPEVSGSHNAPNSQSYRPGVRRIYDDRSRNVREERIIRIGIDDIVLTTTTYEYDDSQSFLLSRIVRDEGGLELTTEYQYEVQYGEWRKIKEIVDPDGLALTTSYEYNVWGNITRIIEPPGDENLARYETLMEYEEFTHRMTRQKRIYHDGQNELLVSETEFLYSPDGKLLRMTSAPESAVERFTIYKYDEAGRQIDLYEGVLTIDGDDPDVVAGNVTTYSYETATDRIDAIWQRAGWADEQDAIVVMEYEYNADGSVASVTDALGNTTEYTYDQRGRLISTKEPLDVNQHRYTAFEYDNLNRLIDTKIYDEDPATVPAPVPLSHTATLYDGAGRAYRQVEYNPGNTNFSRATNYHYDHVGNLVRIRDAENNATDYVYDTAGRQVAVIDALGNAQYTTYDPAGRVVLTHVKHVGGMSAANYVREMMIYYYDDYNELTTISNWGRNMPANWNWGDFTEPVPYDYQWIPATPPTASDSDQLVTIYERGFDLANDSIFSSVVDPAGIKTTTYSDILGRTIKVIEDHGDGGQNINRTTEYRYGLATEDPVPVYYDEIIAHNSGAVEQVTTYYRTAPFNANLVTVVEYPDEGEITFTHNHDGSTATRTDQRDWTTTFTYDHAGRLVDETVATQSGTIPGTSNITYEYDALDRLTSTRDDNGYPNQLGDWESGFEYSWVQANQQVVESQKHALFTYDIVSTYDRVGNRTQLQYPALPGETPRTLSMAFDTLNRQRRINEGQGIRLDNTYRGLHPIRRAFEGQFGSSASFNIQMGTWNTFTGYRDEWGRLKQIITMRFAPGEIRINDPRYTYDPASNIAFYRENTHRAHDEHYQYDRLHRLQDFKRGQYVQSPSRQQTWQLDRLGNWTGITSETAQQPGSPTQTRTHDNANQVETVTDTLPNPDDTISVTYDAAGNLHILPDQNDETKARRFAYDFRNRLITIEESEDYDLFEPSWELIARYHYDSFNRRLKKHLTNENDVVYLYSGWQCIEEREFDDTAQEWQPRRQFIYGGQGIDDVVIFENYDTTAQEWDRHYYSKGVNHNTLALTDSNGVPVEYYLYDPYGKATFLDGSRQPIAGRATANPYLFQSRRLDEETGLYYYRNRYYCPDLGRFLQRDPLGYVDGMNLYEFVRSRPVVMVDPFGQKATWLVSAGAGNISFVYGRTLAAASATMLTPTLGGKHCMLALNCWSVGVQAGISLSLSAAVVRTEHDCCEDMAGKKVRWVQGAVETPIGGGSIQLWTNRVGLSAGKGARVMLAFVQCTIETASDTAAAIDAAISHFGSGSGTGQGSAIPREERGERADQRALDWLDRMTDREKSQMSIDPERMRQYIEDRNSGRF